MEVQYYGRNYDIGRRFREHAEPRLDGLQPLFDDIGKVKIAVEQQRAWKTVEITLDVDGTLFRAEQRSNDALASFDKAFERMQRQLRRYHKRLTDHQRKSLREVASEQARNPVEIAEETEAEDEGAGAGSDDEIEIVRRKTHALKPMSAEEAALQMEMLGHDFFLFFDAEKQQVEVVYRRQDGGYGVIEPSIG